MSKGEGSAARGVLVQDALQGAAVHLQPAGGFGDVAVALLEHALDVLPPHAVGGHRVFRRGGQRAAVGQQGGFHGVGVRRLRQIVHRAGLHRGDRRGDVAVAGQHDDAGVGAGVAQGLDHVQAAAVGQPQVDHREGRRRFLGHVDAELHAVHGDHVETALFHGAREAGSERRVVVDDEEAAGNVTRERQLGGFARWTLVRGHRAIHH
ncbi:protein of unknown function [Azospirillum baldaniorum]|uniref:Uncharacterized protein n=1 Tax=Azospirillum baldaniorum TaxID=1064539 RepID=A0A9P1JP30_9PROT|nr:protein of unknown function [Azospirillum baldaniorum]